jgi:hypothetical protein
MTPSLYVLQNPKRLFKGMIGSSVLLEVINN